MLNMFPSHRFGDLDKRKIVVGDAAVVWLDIVIQTCVSLSREFAVMLCQNNLEGSCLYNRQFMLFLKGEGMMNRTKQIKNCERKKQGE